MATDVLQSSDRSQTRLGTIMASKIMRLATQAGLMGPTGASSMMGPISNTTQSPSSCAVNQDERTSISSTTSLTSTRLARKSSGENPDVNHQGNSTHEVEMVLTAEPLITPIPRFPSGTPKTRMMTATNTIQYHRSTLLKTSSQHLQLTTCKRMNMRTRPWRR
ncbi:hypothetical protein PSTT_14826 [Puccinia striiformis]|uniref:Uncharacterized protein n=1 Tax=Puccinia striiformis TaxID=27350 RepID=A0A2S4UKR3_9BASI|nr:hypothetical protein PSTT_14826 [Puccinia striiformis]